MSKLITALLLVACLFASGCGLVNINVNGQQVDASSAGAAVGSAKDAAAKAACTTIRTQLDQQFTVVRSDTLNTDISLSFGSLVKRLKVKCPAGGTYTWDEKAKTTACSVHGE